MIIEMHDFQVLLTKKRIKNINLRIQANGQVNVSAPYHYPMDTILRFLHEKKEWIRSHQARLKARPTPESLQLQSGEQHFFLGQPYTLQLIEDTQKKLVTLDKDRLYCFVPIHATLHAKWAVLHAWHRQQMQILVPDLIKKWEKKIGVQVNSYGIKAMKTRWGSCNTVKKHIWLNLHLIQKPVICLEYVIVHELVHLLEPSHNHRFYAFMNQFMPDWKDYKTLLH